MDAKDQMTKKQAERAIVKIKENYILWEKSIVDQLNMSSQHHLTTGGFREEVWKSMFDRMVPHKFSIARSVFIIDSYGNISNEVDLAIFDEQYTPYIFQNGVMKYIPIEAVSVVVQCKSTSLNGVQDWARSVAKLRTSLTGISRMAASIVYGDLKYKDEDGNWIPDICKKSPLTQTSTRPVRILCHMANYNLQDDSKDAFDLIISPANGRLSVVMPSKSGKNNCDSDTIAYWIKELNHQDESIKIDHAEIHTKLEKMTLSQLKVQEKEGNSQEISLLALTFQLNQLLMLINNPILFPHQAYANMFNRVPIPDQSRLYKEEARKIRNGESQTHVQTPKAPRSFRRKGSKVQ
ncbi:hypothetical protein J2Z22_001681 [Paenibacillus forsythiae]|uniref:DUF6602 domain-containing protein n=1 Tax=Paenibacillus forsythiae TaxID=365616 RepID=A0ABU3H5R2_9BACL|nr:DUF6602 domain-containing protein [Paenibacillus forsythiae]MDT3426161.1 hypothetical protein [Paenibacillus forsythiae]